ncbi:hypothetical protein ACHAXA_001354 [Cyclostephanos tholiformis]|uniref:Cyclin N-terminal domain-containing protein n=1 Tax=Cyclostephanos tholiformis TaxID=382380 RepID=A0ABD3R7Q9_9STRA
MTTFNEVYYNECVLERINAMRMREEKTARCRDYLTPQVDAAYRKLMVERCFAVVDAFALGKETVGAAVSIFDRYFSSGNGKSLEALKSPQKFRMAVVASFFVAIKLHEPKPSVLGITSFFVAVKLCLGVYEGSDILITEEEILSALEWRVYASSTTPMEYVRHYVVLLLPMLGLDVADLILESAAKRTYFASSDVYFSTCRASSVGMACVMGAIDDVRSISSSDKEAIWRDLSSKLDWDIKSEEIAQIKKILSVGVSSSEFRTLSRTGSPNTSVDSTVGQSLSPRSVGLIIRSLLTIVLKEVFLYISVFSLMHSLRAQLMTLSGKLHQTQGSGGLMIRQISCATYERDVVTSNSSSITCCC